MKKKLLPLLFLLASLTLTNCVKQQTSESETKEETSSSEIITSIESSSEEETSETTSEESSSEETTSEETTSEESSSETSSSHGDEHYTGYYSSISYSMQGSELLAALQTLMFSTRKLYCTYGDIRYKFASSDKHPDNSSKVCCFYTHEALNSAWEPNNNYNREHVWPKSKSGGLFPSGNTSNSYKGAGSDLHHIRPAKVSINGDRGNEKFGTFVPLNIANSGADARGDCARICMYLYMHYSTHVNGTGTNRAQYAGNLVMSNVFTSYTILKNWNKLDPVDDLERARNEYCYSYQGNRNPFIDHPEWIDLINL